MTTTKDRIVMAQQSSQEKVFLGMARWLLAWFALGIACQAQALSITDIGFGTLPGGRLEIRLDFDGQPPEPETYSIERPARLALDFAGVASALESKKHTVASANTTSVFVLDAGDRTRVVVNMIELTPYTTRIEGNSVFLELGDAVVQEYLKPISDVADTIKAQPQPVQALGAVTGVDFTRGENGEGRLSIDLSNPRIDVNVYVEGEEIHVDLLDALIPENLRRRYDVGDFATPVRVVDAMQSEQGVQFSIKAEGNYDYLAYQADNRYVVSVKPLTEVEIEERKAEFAYVGDKLSLNFQDIEVRAVLQLIADFTGLNLVASDTVNGRITLRLQNVPWDQALDLILKTKGLDKRQIGNVLMVAPAAEIAERERQQIEANQQIEELAPLQTEYIKVRYANARELFKLFDSSNSGGSGGDSGNSTGSILSERGSVIVDERTNSLLVTETAQNLERFRRLVQLIDVPIRQVLIEARIVIASSDFSEQLGIKWGGAGIDTSTDSSGNLDRYLVVGGGQTSTIELGDDLASGDRATVSFPQALGVDLGVAATGASRFSIGYATSDLLLNMELSALEAQGRGEVVSQPKVITGDKQTASIKSGTEIPYQESSANGETTVAFKEAVLKLSVTPSITPDDRIIMDLQINQDSVGDLIDGENGSKIPTIDTTELHTQVLVGNGETVVLGGVFRTEDLESVTKTPFLGDIPYLGRLFKRTVVSKVKTETLIFITPRILSDALLD